MELRKKEIKDITFTYFTRHDHSSLDNFIDRIKANINKRKNVTNLYNEIINAWINFDTVNDFNNWFDDRWLQISEIERSSLYENISLWMIVNGFGLPVSLRIDGEKFDDGYTPAKAMGEENYKEYQYLTDYVRNDKRAYDAFEAELNRHHDEITALYDDVEGTYYMIECLFEEFKKEIERSARTANEKEQALNDLINNIKGSNARNISHKLYYHEYEAILLDKKIPDNINKQEILVKFIDRIREINPSFEAFIILAHSKEKDENFKKIYKDNFNLDDIDELKTCFNRFYDAYKKYRKQKVK